MAVSGVGENKGDLPLLSHTCSFKEIGRNIQENGEYDMEDLNQTQLERDSQSSSKWHFGEENVYAVLPILYVKKQIVSTSLCV